MTDVTTRAGANPPGNGTTYNAIAGTTFLIGTPVVQDPSTPSVLPGQATNAVASRVVGLAAGAGVEGGPVPVQYAGPLQLTVAQWDALTGDTGGLIRGELYFLDVALGKLSVNPPVAGGQFVVAVGMASAATELIVNITPAPLPI